MSEVRHFAKAGDLVCGRVGGDGDWMILAVAMVDDDGFVAVVRDQSGDQIAVTRVFGVGTSESPHLIIPAETLTAEGRREAVGLCADELSVIKACLRDWKAVTLQ